MTAGNKVVVTVFEPDAIRDGAQFDYYAEVVNHPSNVDLDIINENTTAMDALQRREGRLATHEAASRGSVPADSVTRGGSEIKRQFSLKEPIDIKAVNKAAYNFA